MSFRVVTSCECDCCHDRWHVGEQPAVQAALCPAGWWYRKSNGGTRSVLHRCPRCGPAPGFAQAFQGAGVAA